MQWLQDLKALKYHKGDAVHYRRCSELYTIQAYAVVYTMNAGVSHLQCYAHLIIICARICASPHSPLPTPFKCALSLSLIPFKPNKGIIAGF